MSEIFCVKCGKNHTSKEQYCEFCGTDLEHVINKFKQKQKEIETNELPDNEKKLHKEDVSGMAFYEEIKQSEKRRKRYGDRMLKSRVFGTSTYEERKRWDRISDTGKVLIIIGSIVLVITVIVFVILFLYWFFDLWG